jgi:hypothetical protein
MTYPCLLLLLGLVVLEGGLLVPSSPENSGGQSAGYSAGVLGLLPYVIQGGNPSLRLEHGSIPCVLLRLRNGVPEFAETTLLALARRESHEWRRLQGELRLREAVAPLVGGVPGDDGLNSIWPFWQEVLLEAAAGETIVIYPVPREISEEMTRLQNETEDGTGSTPGFILACVPARVN